MTIARKFVLTCAAVLALTVALGVVSLLAITNLDRAVTTVVTDPLPGVYRISQVESLVFELRGDTWKHISSPDPSEKQAIERNQQETKQKIEDNLRGYQNTITTDEDRRLFAAIRPLYDGYIHALELAVLPLSREGKSAEARTRYLQEADSIFSNLERALRELVEFNRRQGDIDAQAADETATRGRFTTLLLLVVAILGGCTITFFVVRSVNRALAVAVSELNTGSEYVATAASQVASSSQSMAQGASEQAASLEETSASAEEITSMARQNSERSGEAANLMGQSHIESEKTHRSLREMVTAMSDINDSSQRISRIIKVIDEIAFQTNILALNAAVEAARAGEAGAGFAVVADEVRNLAQRSAQAAKDTATLIEESIQKSQHGKIRVDEVVQSINGITTQIQIVKTLVDDVSVGSQEQVRALEQVAKAVTQMDQVTQNTAASAEEGASAAQELASQSKNVKQLAQRLRLMVTRT